MNKRLRTLIAASLFAAMITLLTSFGKVPVGRGYIHLGDGIIYLAACILPAPYAIIAASTGGAMADAFGGYAAYIIPTLIIKALITLPYSSEKDMILNKRNIRAAVISGLITIVGYALTELVLYGWPGVIVSLSGSAVQSAGSAVLFFALAFALDKINFKRKIGIEKKFN
jgi:uncharacterized repeat protein (TIGR04002 family)